MCLGNAAPSSVGAVKTFADEILEYRRALRLLAQAIGWADAGAPFGVVGPGPYWRPRRTIDGTPEVPDVAPPAA